MPTILENNKITIQEDASTRDAVESSIDASKQSPDTTWEESAKNKLQKVGRWRIKYVKQQKYPAFN